MSLRVLKNVIMSFTPSNIMYIYLYNIYTFQVTCNFIPLFFFRSSENKSPVLRSNINQTETLFSFLIFHSRLAAIENPVVIVSPPALPYCGCIKYLKEKRDLFFPIPAILYFFATVKKITLHSNEGTGPHEIWTHCFAPKWA